jgi:predicted DNA-binding transcriptional regulator AlpA
MSKRNMLSSAFEAAHELHPNEIVRKSKGSKYFGLKSSQLADAIKKRKIPPPFPLTEGGRASGWTGQQIIDHQRQRIAACEQARRDAAFADDEAAA